MKRDGPSTHFVFLIKFLDGCYLSVFHKAYYDLSHYCYFAVQALV
jgi:hypothetical protein